MENTNCGGVGFLGMLGILFIGLKLTGHIDWSWWWVTLPLWGAFAVIIAALLVVFVGFFVAYVVGEYKK